MTQKRYSVEQIVAKLREAEKLQGQGMTIPMCGDHAALAAGVRRVSYSAGKSEPVDRS